MSKIVYLIGGIIVIVWMFFAETSAKFTLQPGVLIPEAPQQQNTARKPWRHGDYLIEPLAKFTMRGRVIDSAHYWFDGGASLAPVDLSLAWGPLSNTDILEKLNWSQFGRFYSWSARELPLPVSVISEHTSNMHMIPSNSEIEETLKSLDRDDLISLAGYLVKVSRKDGWNWTSSLSRKDTGNGACELVWLDSLERL